MENRCAVTDGSSQAQARRACSSTEIRQEWQLAGGATGPPRVTLQGAQECPGILQKCRVCLRREGWRLGDLRPCISNKLPCDADAAVLRTLLLGESCRRHSSGRRRDRLVSAVVSSWVSQEDTHLAVCKGAPWSTIHPVPAPLPGQHSHSFSASSQTSPRGQKPATQVLD